MQSFVKMTKLSNISGRAGYITNPDKQEEIVIMSESIDWTPYVEFEKQKAVKTNEGRELVISIPNEWYHLPKMELYRRCQEIVVKAVGKETDLQWAVHWNKNRTNLHIHAIFSERQKEKEVKRWDRDIYHTADGKIARKKADRAIDEDGKVRPPVHKKGDLKGGFSVKDTKYKKRGWLHETKQDLKAFMQERFGVKFDKQGILHQYHEGKGSESPRIKKKNIFIKLNNEQMNLYIEKWGLSEKQLKPLALKAVKENKCLYIEKTAKGFSIFRLTPEEFEAVINMPKSQSEIYETQAAEMIQLKAEFDIKYDLLTELVAQRNQLGIFKGKEKKELDAVIEKERYEIKNIENKLYELGVPQHINTPSDIEKAIKEKQRLAEEERYKEVHPEPVVQEKKEPLKFRIEELEKQFAEEKAQQSAHNRNEKKKDVHER